MTVVLSPDAERPSGDAAPRPSQAARTPWWPGPAAPAPAWAVVAAVIASGFALAVAGGVRPGLGVLLVAVVVGGVAVRSVWTARDAGDRLLLLLAVALSGAAVLRDSPWLVALCLLGALGLLAFVAVGARRWPSALLAPLALGLGGLHGLVWASRRVARARRPGGAWWRGTVVGVVLAWAVAALLVSGDPAFGQFLGRLAPSVSLDLPGVRVTAALVVLGVVLAVAYCGAAPPAWVALRVPPAHRPAAEWGLPLALLDAVLALWVGLQTALLFGGAEVLVGNSLTYADRARQGFFQLVAVTLLVVAVLGWAAHCAGGTPRAVRLLGGLGGGLVVLALVVVGSALRRMWLYEQAYGWTVLRVVVAAFELWLALVLVLLCGAWFLGRTAGAARLVLAAAGTSLLVLALVGPDALVARLSVARAASGATVDTGYLATLSADAVPDLVRLPPRLAACALSGRSVPADPWPAWNLSRVAARAALAGGGAPAGRSTPALDRHGGTQC